MNAPAALLSEAAGLGSFTRRRTALLIRDDMDTDRIATALANGLVALCA